MSPPSKFSLVTHCRQLILFLVLHLALITGLCGQAYASNQDSLTVYQYGGLAFELRAHHPDSALLLSTQALALAIPAQDSQAMVNLWRITGVIHYGEQDYDKAYAAFANGYEIARRVHFREGRLLINLGNVAFQQENYPQAVERFNESLEISAGVDTLVWMDAATNLAGAFISTNNHPKAIPFLETALLLQETTGKEFTQLPILYNLGYAQVKSNRQEEGIINYKKGIALAKRINKPDWVGTFLKKIASAYLETGRYPQSVAFYQRAISLFDSLGDFENVDLIVYDIGVLNLKSGDYSLSLQYLQRALDSAIVKNDLSAQANTLNSIGSNYKQLGAYESATTHFHQSKLLWEQIGSSKSIYYPLYNLGDTYQVIGQLDSALYYLIQASDKTRGITKSYQDAILWTSLGKVYLGKKKFEQAKGYFLQAIEVAKKSGLNKEERDASWQLYKLLRAQGQPAAALPFLERYQQLQDSLFNEESVREITNLEATYAYEKEKTSIAEENERQKRALDEKLSRQRFWQLFLGISFLLSLLGLFLYFRFQRYRQAAELKIEQQERAKLVEIDAFRSRFFANISHELRTPLTLILGPVRRLLRRSDWSQEEHIQLQLIQDNAKQLRARVEEILDLTRLEAGHLQLNEKATRLFGFCGRLLASFESYAQQKDQQLSFNYLPSKDFFILLDQGKFAHVLNNLLSNAIKFTPENGEISVSIAEHAEKPQCLVLAVADNGPGIREEDVAHLFDRYYQARGNHNQLEGSGIGLALSQEIAQAMKAELRVVSVYGKGSTFYFEFPYCEVLGVAASEPTNSDTISMGVTGILPIVEIRQSAAKILVVEDNKQLREYLSFVLSEHFQVATASNGVKALEQLANETFQLVISDVMMPRMDGFELLKQIKTSDNLRHLPVVMLTARSEMRDKLQALRIGVDDYILKPFVEEELLARVQNLIVQQNQRTTVEEGEQPIVEIAVNVSAAELEWLAQLETLLKSEVSNANFNMLMVEKQLFISRSKLQRRIKKTTGLTPNKYFREIRLQVARELLESGKIETISEVAAAVGFDTPHYFSTIYEKRFGKRPVEML